MIVLKDVAKIYDLGRYRIDVLSGINLTVRQGEYVTIMAPGWFLLWD